MEIRSDPANRKDRRLVASIIAQAEAEEQRKATRHTATPKELIDGQFDQFWRVVHIKTGRAKAREKFEFAAKRWHRERSDRGEQITVEKVCEEVVEAMRKFADTPQARPTDHSPIHPATWLHQGRYEDDVVDKHDTQSTLEF